MASFSAEEQEQKNEDVAYQLFEAHNRQDIEKMGQLVSSSNNNYSFHLPGMPPMDWNGHKQLLAALFNAFPDFYHKLEDVVAEGDRVAVRFTITATHRGEFQGIPPTGKQISIGGTDFLTIVGGKITEEWVSVDMMGWMQQLGVIPTTPVSS
jgi:steroid delta-isomerase-like uncharacterized protein